VGGWVLFIVEKIKTDYLTTKDMKTMKI